MCLNQVFELSMVLDHEKFRKTLNRVYNRIGYLKENEDGYVDHSMAAKGIVVRYRDSQYRKKVVVIIDTRVMTSRNAIDTKQFARKVDKCLKEYFEYKYRMEDFSLTGAAITADIDVGDHKKVLAYLKVLQRIGRVKGYSPSDYECFEGKECFCLDGNSNGIGFMAYDLEEMLAECLKRTGTGQKKSESVINGAKGTLRVEIRLAKPKAIRSYTSAGKSSDQLSELAENRKEIFLDVFSQIVPYGDYYKKDKAVEIIRESVKDSNMRRKMLRLLALVPEKKSLYLAQKAMNCRNIEKIMDSFAEINISPVTISKRHNEKFLTNLYLNFKGEIMKQ